MFRRSAVRVLVVDDEPDTVITLLELLRHEGYNARGHSSGPEAIKAITDFDPDVIVLDIVMPVLNGWDLAKEVRAIKGERRPVLIAISGEYTKESDKLLSRINGFNHYLTKPCDPKALLALLAQAKDPC